MENNNNLKILDTVFNEIEAFLPDILFLIRLENSMLQRKPEALFKDMSNDARNERNLMMSRLEGMLGLVLNLLKEKDPQLKTYSLRLNRVINALQYPMEENVRLNQELLMAKFMRLQEHYSDAPILGQFNNPENYIIPSSNNLKIVS